MVVHLLEEELKWHPLKREGLEIALMFHSKPGEDYGENLNIVRAISLAKKLGGELADHKLAYLLLSEYSDLLEKIEKETGINHSWITSTLGIYLPKKDSLRESKNYEFEGGIYKMRRLERAGNRVGGMLNWKDEPSEKYFQIEVPESHQGFLSLVGNENYSFIKRKNKTKIVVGNWGVVEKVPLENSVGGDTFALSQLFDKREDSPKLIVPYPLVGFVSPIEGYSAKIKPASLNYWGLVLRGEAGIIKRKMRL